MPSNADQTLQLLERWHRGERAAVEELVSRNLDDLHRLVRAQLDRGFRELRRDQDSMDLVNTVALRVLEYIPPVQPANRAEFLGLLARIVKNDLQNQYRAPRNRLRDSYGSSLLDLSITGSAAERPDRAAESVERREELQAWTRIALEFLPDALERELVLLRVIEEWSWADVGLELGLTAGAARSRFERIKSRLSNTKRKLKEGRIAELLEGSAA